MALPEQALKHHPDKNNGSETERAKAQALFVEVQRAYDTLSDAAARRTYDFEQRRARGGGLGGGFGCRGAARGFGGFSGFEEDDIFSGFHGAGRRRPW